MNEVYFELIRSGLYGTPLAKADKFHNIDWKKLILFAQKQTLMGVIADAVMRLPSELNIPTDIKQKFMESALRIAKSHSIINNKISEIVNFYNSNGITSVLLKGQGIARCYRKPLMRQCGDIDLYVGKKNYYKAFCLSQENIESGSKISYETIKHYHFNTDGIAVDLHHTAAFSPIFRKKEFKKWIESQLENENCLSHLEIHGENVLIPSPLFDSFFIFYHAWAHLILGGIGLRQICDWTMLLNKYYNQIDLIILKSILNKFNLMRPWQIFGNIAVNQLGLPQEKMPFYNPAYKNKSLKFLDLILEGGNFGFYLKEKKYILDNLPFWQRNILKLRNSTKKFFIFASIIPLEATIYFIPRITSASFRTLLQLFHRKK